MEEPTAYLSHQNAALDTCRASKLDQPNRVVIFMHAIAVKFVSRFLHDFNSKTLASTLCKLCRKLKALIIVIGQNQHYKERTSVGREIICGGTLQFQLFAHYHVFGTYGLNKS